MPKNFSFSTEELHVLLNNPEQESNVKAVGQNNLIFKYPLSNVVCKLWTFLENYSPILFFLCSFIDLFLLIALYLTRFPIQPPPYSTGDNIPLGSTYLNFDKLYRNSSFARGKITPIINHSSAFYQISRKEGEMDKVVEVWSNLRFTTVGMVPQYGQHLILNATMSTFAQFPVVDYGMEECSVVISIPPRNKTTALVSSNTQTPPSMEIYTFSAITEKLDPKTLTLVTKPKKNERVHLCSLPVGYGEIHESPKFRCPSLSYQTFEFTCLDCHIDVLTVDKRDEGIYMRQHQTL